MKKTLLAAAVMAASGVAFAASNVTLYGVVDASVVVGKVKHQDTTVQLKSGFRNGSRWGIKGVEDLGNGYAGSFLSRVITLTTALLQMDGAEIIPGPSIVNLSCMSRVISVRLASVVWAL